MNLKKLIKDKFLPISANRYSKEIHLNVLLNNAIARGSLSSLSRNPDPADPASWEFSGFSQNGEDGIIEYLLSGVKESNKYFIEIGTGNGLENNTGFLAHIKKYAGLQIEGNTAFYLDALVTKPWLVECLNCFVNEETVDKILSQADHKNPDFFSVDIDSIDYYIVKLLLEKGLRPKVIVVEYNSAFGPDRSLTIPYKPDFNMFLTDFPYLYYGVSVTGWKSFFGEHDYEFVTVESNGVNAFFIDRKQFRGGFLDNVNKVHFRENVHQLRLFKGGHEHQFKMMEHLPLVQI